MHRWYGCIGCRVVRKAGFSISADAQHHYHRAAEALGNKLGHDQGHGLRVMSSSSRMTRTVLGEIGKYDGFRHVNTPSSGASADGLLSFRTHMQPRNDGRRVHTQRRTFCTVLPVPRCAQRGHHPSLLLQHEGTRGLLRLVKYDHTQSLSTP